MRLNCFTFLRCNPGINYFLIQTTYLKKCTLNFFCCALIYLPRIPASVHKKHKPSALQFSIYQHTICHYANNISRLLCSNGYRHKNVNAVLFASESGDISSHMIGKLRHKSRRMSDSITSTSSTDLLFVDNRCSESQTEGTSEVA